MTRVLVVGATGVFGKRLVKLLQHSPGRITNVLEGSRRPSIPTTSKDSARTKFAAFCIDVLQPNLKGALEDAPVDIVVHTAGPFQSQSDYQVAKACINAKKHYIDIADGRSFVQNIGALHPTAQAAGIAVVAGCSTTPALTSAMVASHLQAHLYSAMNKLDESLYPMVSIDAIDVGISPGNKNVPRGGATMASILSYVGKPIPAFNASSTGKQQTQHTFGWSDLERRPLDSASPDRSIPPRWFVSCDVPDVTMFPQHFAVRERVTFKAGLELSTMTLPLWALGWLVRVGVLQSLSPLQPALQWIANKLLPFGTDRGGMFVDVVGASKAGGQVMYRHTVIATNGDGPYIPVLAAYILTQRLAMPKTTTIQQGSITAETETRPVPTGAYPCIDVVSMDEFKAAASHLDISWECRRVSSAYEDVMGCDAFWKLPEQIRLLHQTFTSAVWRGSATVTAADNPIARLAAKLFRMPLKSQKLPLEFRLTVDSQQRETWERWFGNATVPFQSVQWCAVRHNKRVIMEKFGIFTFAMEIIPCEGGLDLRLVEGRCLGIPIPSILMPNVTAIERVDSNGTFQFHINIASNIIGHMVRYEGNLR